MSSSATPSTRTTAYQHQQFHSNVGDVGIFLSDDGDINKLVFPRTVLAHHSSWFEALLSGRWSTSGQKETDIKKQRLRHIFELRFEDKIGLLVRRGVSAPGDFLSISTIYRDCESREQRLACIKLHFGMLSTFLVQPLSSTILDSTYSSTIQLWEMSRFYGCEETMRKHIEDLFSTHHEQVFSISSPWLMKTLEIATLLQSNYILRTAVIPIIGARQPVWESLNLDQELAKPQIVTLLQTKRSEFVRKLRSCEQELLDLKGTFIHPTQGVEQYHATATAVFRQWLEDSLQQGFGSRLMTDDYARIYSIFLTAGSGAVADD